MAISLTNTEPSRAIGRVFAGAWDSPDGGLGYSCEIRLVPEEGGFVAYVAQLRGVHSQGDTEEEARLNVIDALRATLDAYKDAGEEIPWSKPKPAKEHEISFRILVDA